MLLTFGHGTASQEQIGTLLRDAGVVSLVDIRIAPGSRRHPQVARAELERWLPPLGIGYRWEKRLGGRRVAAPDSLDSAWREPAFRGYAGYMREPGFAAALDGVLAEAAGLERGAAGHRDVQRERLVALPPPAGSRFLRTGQGHSRSASHA